MGRFCCLTHTISFKMRVLLLFLVVIVADANQVGEGKICFAPVVCSKEDDTTPEWIQFDPMRCQNGISSEKEKEVINPPNDSGVMEPLKQSNKKLSDLIYGLNSSVIALEKQTNAEVANRETEFAELNSTITRIHHEIKTGLAEAKDLISNQSEYMKKITETWNSSMRGVTQRLEQLERLSLRVISHDILGEVKIVDTCNDAGCFSRIPQYYLDEEEILRVINSSIGCRQFIKIRCKGVLVNENHNKKYAWWVSRNGENMRYWGGATSRRDFYCACGETGTCIDNKYKCNCDQNSRDVITQDEGYITDKSKLPVRELRFGDTKDPSEAAWYTLGNLECWG